MSTASNPGDDDVIASVKEILDELEQANLATAAPTADNDNPDGSASQRSHPRFSLGAAKLLVQVKYKNPVWELSEKRFRRLLKEHNIQTGDVSAVTASTTAGENGHVKTEGEDKENGHEDGAPVTSSSNKKKKKKKTSGKASSDGFTPSSHIDQVLPLPSNVESHYFDSVKGKGLIATRDFQEGELVFTEDAYICAPPAGHIRNVNRGELCDACFQPIDGNNKAKFVECSHKKDGCLSKWCNRLCWGRAMSSHHPLMCNGANPLIRSFNKFTEDCQWGSAVISARALSRLLLTHSSRPTPSLKGAKTTETAAASIAAVSANSIALSASESNPTPATTEEVKAHFDAFATVNELARRTRSGNWALEQEHYIGHLTLCHNLIINGLHPYSQARVQHETLAQQSVSISNAQEVKQAKKIVADYPVQKTFPRALLDKLFKLDSWCGMLGRANINVENHGSMYLVHSQLNHSCEPNVSVRHLAARGSVRPATKVSVITVKPIAKGQELLISYIPIGPREDGSSGPNVRRRRLQLWREYMFGPCECDRCLQELGEMDEEERNEILKELKTGDWKRDKEQEAAVQAKLEELKESQGEQGEEKQQQLSGEAPAGAGPVDRKSPTEGTGQQASSERDLTGLADEVKTVLGF